MSQDSTETIQELRDQLIQQKSQIEFQTNQLEILLQRQGVPEMPNTNEVQMSETPLIHDLPVRPSYDWTPSPELASLMPSRQQDIFLQVLDADTRKAMVEQYPSMAGVRYTPPQRLPVAARKYNKSQIREDDNLQRIQYAISAALRPLDVLAHMLLPLVPSEDVDRVYSTINDTRLLILNSAGVVNDQRTNIMLRAVNPEFQQPQSDGHYIMPVSTFQETLTQQSALHKAMRDAQPKRPNQHRSPQPNPPQPSQQFFRTGPSPGGGGREQYNHKNSKDGSQRSKHNSNNPYKNRPPPKPQHQ